MYCCLNVFLCNLPHFWQVCTFYFLHSLSRFAGDTSNWSSLPALLAPCWALLFRGVETKSLHLKGLSLFAFSICIHIYSGNNSYHLQSPLQVEGLNTIGCLLVPWGDHSWHCHHHSFAMQPLVFHASPCIPRTINPVSHLYTLSAAWMPEVGFFEGLQEYDSIWILHLKVNFHHQTSFCILPSSVLLTHSTQDSIFLQAEYYWWHSFHS